MMHHPFYPPALQCAQAPARRRLHALKKRMEREPSNRALDVEFDEIRRELRAIDKAFTGKERTQ